MRDVLHNVRGTAWPTVLFEAVPQRPPQRTTPEHATRTTRTACASAGAS